MFEIEQALAFSYPRRELAVAGWCCFDDRTEIDDLWVAYEGQRIPCLTGLSRPEIGRQLIAQGLTHAGFLCRFPVSNRATATLVARRDGVDEVLGEFPATGSKTRSPEADRGEYATWLRAHEPKLHWPAAEVERRLASLTSAPIFSVVLPTYN